MPVIRPPFLSKLVGEDAIFKYLGALCVIYAIIHLVFRRSLPRAKALQLKLFGLYFAWAVLSYWVLGLTFTPILSLGSMLLLMCVVLVVVDNEKRLLGTMTAMVASLVLASAYVIREWQVYHSIYSDLRASGIAGDSNYFTASAILGLPVAYHLVMDRSRRMVRLFYLFAIPVILVSVMLGASRGGLLGLCVAAFFVVFRSRRRVIGLISITVVLGLFLVLAPNSPLNRFLHPSYGDQIGVSSREAAWRAGFNMIETHPLFGIGIGNFKPLMPQFAGPDVQFQQIAHNTYIEVAAEMGIPALLLFLTMLGSTFVSLQRVRKRAIRTESLSIQRAAEALQIGLLGYLVDAVFLSVQYEKMFWLVFGLSIVLPILQARVESSLQEAEDQVKATAFSDVIVRAY